MSKRTLLQIVFAAAALAPALPQAQVFFWRDARNVANYADLCPAGVACGVRQIRMHSPGYLDAGTARSTDATGIAASSSSTNTAASSMTAFGVGGMAGGGGGASAGSAGGGGVGGGGGGSGGASASVLAPPSVQPGTSTPSAPPPSTPSPSQPTQLASSDAQPMELAANSSTSTTSSSTPTRRSPIGTNLEGISYWTPQLPFVDLMKSSAGWSSNDGKPLDQDENGWVRSLGVGQTARTLMAREIDGHYPSGRYTLRYKGEGKISVRFDAKVASQRSCDMQLDVVPSSGGIWVEIESTNPANYVRDLEVLMPGGICDGDPFTHVLSAGDCGSRRFLSFKDNRDILFYPVFANRLRAYSVLRFMDWMDTNNSPVTGWTMRTPVSYSTWATTNGAPPEVTIALANLVGAHPWFTIPHQADDAYVVALANLVKSQLDPALKVYVEHSNETWNSAFSQWRYVVAQGQSQVPPINGNQYHALRSRTIGQLFKAALGESRVVAVLGAQAANSSTATEGLDYLKTRVGSLGIDAVAIAPYFILMPNPSTAPTYTSMSMDALFSYVRTVALPESSSWIRKYHALANRYDVHLISYEGGQHLVGVAGAENDDALTTLFTSFNRDPRIKQLYLDYLNNWKSAGGELFMHFNDVSRYTKWGSWGALEYIAEPRALAPKFDALQTFIEQNQVWWSP